MQCKQPIAIEVKGERIFAPCNRCNFCLANRRNEWSFRMYYHLKGANRADFLTLTYDNAHLPLVQVEGMRYSAATLHAPHLQLFFKTLKQRQKRLIRRKCKLNQYNKEQTRALLNEWEIKYFAVGEYGTQYKRPHYHTIVYNVWPDLAYELVSREKNETLWGKGLVHRGNATPASIQYCAKYVIDKSYWWKDDARQKPFSLISKGIGENYIEKRAKWHIEGLRGYVMLEGQRARMPKYYKMKIFSKEQRAMVGEKLSKDIEKIHATRFDELVNYYKDELTAHEKFIEEINTKHELIRIKSLKLNKL